MFPELFREISLGPVRLKNRIAMAPMGTGGLTLDDGSLSQRCIDYYLERARGGTGLIISGCTRSENRVERIPIHIPPGPEALASYAELAEGVHSHGARIFVQLTAGFGRVLGGRMIPGMGSPVSASATPAFWKPEVVTRALETAEVEEIARSFGRSARILARAGIDGIHLHGHEGYLFDQFATAFWNQRTDRYGGSLENRLRLATEAIAAIKDAAGPNFPVIFQIGLKHYITAAGNGSAKGILPGHEADEAGRDLEEGLAALKLLEAAGADAFHVDAGCYESWYWAHPPGYQPRGCMLEMARRAKETVSVPVIAVGRLDDPQVAERALAEGMADMISLGRALLADPSWPLKVREGAVEEIRPCIGCQYCLLRMMRDGKPLSCAVNPLVGRERLYPVEPARISRRITVIGGGVAGMEAARVARLRGHEVSLYEKTEALGGHLKAAAAPDFKVDLKRLVDWYRNQLQALGVRVHLNRPADPALVAESSPEAVVMATGSRPLLPEIPGLDPRRMVSCIEVLAGRREVGRRVVVLGGGLVGCETALWLARDGKEVTIVEALEKIDLGIFKANEMMLLEMLEAEGVRIIAGASVAEATPEGELLLSGREEGRKLSCDDLIVAIGLEPVRELYEDLERTVPEFYNLGDSFSPQKVKEAIWSAFFAARTMGDR